jgi:hypothetical protein
MLTILTRTNWNLVTFTYTANLCTIKIYSVAGYIGNYVDPITQKSYFVFMTRDRQIIHIPANLPVELQPRRSPRSISRIARRTQRREEMRRFNQNQLQQMFANPHNIFNPQLPPAPMQRPASPVRQQPPNPQSHRQQRKERQQQRQQRQQSNVISQSRPNRVVGGAKTKRRRRH